MFLWIMWNNVYDNEKQRKHGTCEEKEEDFGVDASYGDSFLWWNNVFSLSTLYSNAYGD
jgi:hypothetical protein